jgi:hypothetical protein
MTEDGVLRINLEFMCLPDSYCARILVQGRPASCRRKPAGCLEEQQTKPVTNVYSHSFQSGDRIVEPMIGLPHCSPPHRILVAGAKSVELALELNRRGFAGVA